MFKELIKSKLESKRQGSSTIEYIVCFPMTLVLVVFCVYICVLIMSWMTYTSAASYLARDLDFRATGLAEAAKEAPVGNVAVQHTHKVMVNGVATSATETDTLLTYNQIVTNGKRGNSYNENKAVALNLNKYVGMLKFPWTRIEEVRVDIYNANNSSLSPQYKGHDKKYVSNSIIQVKIIYSINLTNSNGNTWNVLGTDFSTRNRVAYGYSTIT